MKIEEYNRIDRAVKWRLHQAYLKENKMPILNLGNKKEMDSFFNWLKHITPDLTKPNIGL